MHVTTSYREIIKLTEMREQFYQESLAKDKKQKEQKQYRRNLLQAACRRLIAKCISEDRERNFLSQIEYKMVRNLKGEKFINFNRNDFIGWYFIEDSHIDENLKRPKHAVRFFLEYLQNGGYILPQVHWDIWDNSKFTVKFFWDDTETD